MMRILLPHLCCPHLAEERRLELLNFHIDVHYIHNIQKRQHLLLVTDTVLIDSESFKKLKKSTLEEETEYFRCCCGVLGLLQCCSAAVLQSSVSCSARRDTANYHAGINITNITNQILNTSLFQSFTNSSAPFPPSIFFILF